MKNSLYFFIFLVIIFPLSICAHVSGGQTLNLDTTVDGALTVNNATNFLSSATITGATTINGLTTLGSGADLHVTGSTYHSGQIEVNVNKFIVDASGNTTIAGTVGATGATTLNGGATIGSGTDLRVTGSTHLLGKIDLNSNKFTVDASGNTTIAGTVGTTGATTLNGGVTIGSGTDLRVTGSTHLLGKIDLNSNKFTVDASGNVAIAGNTTMGSKRIFGYKTISSIGTSATNALTLTFANLGGSSSPLNKGANVRLSVMIAGSITIIITAADSVNYYDANLFVSPGATSGANCALASIAASTTTAVGNGATITAGISGTGTTATITLASSTTISSQSVVIFYEVMSDNVTSVA